MMFNKRCPQFSTWLILIGVSFIIILTIISKYSYRRYINHRRENLKELISTLQSSLHVNTTNLRPFESTSLPLHLTAVIRTHLSKQFENYLIVDCRTGLGNRLQSIVSGFLMALLMNRRLVIHWPVTTLSSCQFERLFETVTPLSSALLNLYTRDFIYANGDHLTFHGPFDELLCHWNLTQFKREFKFLFVSTDEYFMSVLMKNPAYSQTLFAGVKEDVLFKSLVNYLFRPNKQLNDRIQLYNNSSCNKGIHMRKEGLKQIKTDGEKKFLDCISNETVSDNERWFIASDYAPFKTYIQSHLPSTSIQVLSLNSSGDASQCSDVQQAVIELWLLARCDRLFLTQWSSFSWLASGISGTDPVIVSATSCHVQPFSSPCYYELTHIKQLSCYDYNEMVRNDGCCRSEGFCQSICLHHSPKYGLHSSYFLLVWPVFPLVKWLFKWLAMMFSVMFLLSRMTTRWTLVALLHVYKRIIICIPFVCIVYINTRCLVWSFVKIL